MIKGICIYIIMKCYKLSFVYTSIDLMSKCIHQKNMFHVKMKLSLRTVCQFDIIIIELKFQSLINLEPPIQIIII